MSDVGFVYAMAAANGLVKIGYSEKPRLRLSKINSDAGSPCELVGFVPATRAQEADLHKLLTPERSYREWYRHGELTAHFLSLLPVMQGRRAGGRQRKFSQAGAHPLSTYRARSGKTLGDLAKLVGVTQCSLSRIENGKQGITAQMAMTLGRVTGIPLHELRPDLWPAPASQHADAGQ